MEANNNVLLIDATHALKYKWVVCSQTTTPIMSRVMTDESHWFDVNSLLIPILT